MINSRIIGTGSYLPKEILTNAGLEKIIDTTDEWIMKRVGIRERHLIGKSSDTTSSMTAHAARQALQASGMSPNDIELIVVATASADYYFPSAACELQLLLNIDNGCPAFDVNAACAGFIYGISVADQYIKNGVAKNALVVGVDALSRALDWTDRSTCVLFGDGAGAVVLQASEEQGVIITNMHAAGKYRDHIYARSGLWCKTEDAGVIHMDGREVFRLAVTKLEEIVIETLQKAGMQKSDIDWLIPHQANIRIVQAIAKRLDLPMEKVILTIEHHGNTSAASIPLALDQSVRKGTIKRGQVLMLEAFGAGLAWGSALVRY